MKRNISCYTVRQTMLLSTLQQLLELSAVRLCPYARSKMLTPPTNCIVNDAQFHPCRAKRLTKLSKRFFSSVLMHLLLDVAPYLENDRIKGILHLLSLIHI